MRVSTYVLHQPVGLNRARPLLGNQVVQVEAQEANLAAQLRTQRGENTQAESALACLRKALK